MTQAPHVDLSMMALTALDAYDISFELYSCEEPLESLNLSKFFKKTPIISMMRLLLKFSRRSTSMTH
jgi:hypothetical protein